jgi:hypothetical protein
MWLSGHSDADVKEWGSRGLDLWGARTRADYKLNQATITKLWAQMHVALAISLIDDLERLRA